MVRGLARNAENPMPQKPPMPQATMTQKEFNKLWKTLPELDRRYFRTMIVIQDAMGLKDLHYHLPPAEIVERLVHYDQHTLFSILADCVGLLTGAPAMERVKDAHRRMARARDSMPPAHRRRS